MHDNSRAFALSRKAFNYLNVEPWLIVFALLTSIYILPIWLFTYFPSQDGPCHLYNAFILKNYNDPGYTFSQVYDIRHSLIPNWTSHALLVLLMGFCKPLIAEKVLLTGYVLLMSTGLLYYVSTVEKNAKPLALLGFPYIYNGLFVMGFYNYAMGVGLMLISIGYWWKNGRSGGQKKILVLGIFMLLLYFTHPVALVLTMFSILMMNVWNLINRFIGLKKAPLIFFAFAIPTILLLYHMEEGSWYWGDWTFSRLLKFFWENGALVYHSPNQQIFPRILTWTFAVLVVYTLFKEHVFKKEHWFGRKGHAKDFFLILSVTFLIFYFIFPDRMSGGAVIKGRLSILPFLIIIPWINWGMSKKIKNAIGALLIVVAVGCVTQVSAYHKRLSAELETYMSGVDVVKRNSVMLPLCFDASGSGWLIGTFQHALGYYGCMKGGIDLGNYEAATGHFPTIFKPDYKRPDIAEIEKNPGAFDFGRWSHVIDYVVTWALPEPGETASRLNHFYEPVKQKGKLKIFRKRGLPSAEITERNGK